MKKIRYGVIGLAHGASHLGFIRGLAGGELAAICDLDANRLRGAGEHSGVAGADRYTDAAEMLAREDIDAVVVATPPKTHKVLAQAVLDAGKHLMLEKPLSNTVDDGRAIAEIAAKAAAEKKLVTQIGFCVRSSQLVDRCRQIIQSGEIGTTVLLWFNMVVLEKAAAESWRNEADLASRKLYDCCCHYLDMMGLLAGGRWRRVCAFGGPARSTGPSANGSAEVANVIVEQDNGVKLTLNLSDVSQAGPNSFFGIIGTRGRIDSDPFYPEGAGSIRMWSEGGLYESNIVIKGDLATRGHLGFGEQHQHFLATIADGAPNVCSADDALENLLLLAAIRDSLMTGKVVERQ